MANATTERPTSVENIKVLQVGKFGVRVDEKTWFGVNAPLTPTHFNVGSGYKVSVTVSKTGKKYINEIIGVEDSAPAATSPATSPVTSPATTPVDSDPVKAAEAALAKAKADAKAAAEAPKTTTGKAPSRAGYDKPLTEYDLAKDRQISRSGVVQAALQSPGIVQWSTNLDEYLSNVRKVADFAFKYVQE